MHRQWIIPDLHGYVETFRALIEEVIRPARYDELFLLGDYIDRGPDSKGVIDYIRFLSKDGYNITALKGNHEDMLVELWDVEKSEKSSALWSFGNRKKRVWIDMGGRQTLESFGVRDAGEIPPDYIEWMRELPYFHILDKFVLVHAGLNFRNEDPFEDKLSMLWLRDYEIKPEKIGNRRIIHGHNPVNMELINLCVSQGVYKFIDLDNGIYFQGMEGYGKLVALEINSMELVVQEKRDGEM